MSAFRSYRYLFGPVPSRRFGLSLGVDLLLSKTCSFDCVFCQLGATPHVSLERKAFTDVEAVTAELDEWFRSDGRADYVTLGGAGEPTLHTRFGEVVEFARRRGPVRVALLTNGALLHLPDVRAAARAAHVVKASLSAWDDASFGRVNRPAPGLRFEAVVQGERAFREEFSGELWLEVFILNGINDATENVGQIAALAATIRPDRIHLNTVVRPPATAGARPVSREALERLAGLFTPQAEVIADFAPHRAGGGAADGERLLAALARHPATAEQMARAFGVDRQRIDALVNQLLSEGKVEVSVREGEPYYVRAAGIDGA